jgi:putative salt-induced outer membrane protein
MNRITVLLVAALVTGMPVAALADWSGEGEFGAVVARGNTDSDNYNGRLSLALETGAWKHSAFIAGLGAASNGETNGERYELGAQSNYNINPTSYWFGSFRYEDDRFSAFEYQSTVAGGYGRTFIDDGTTKLSGELGLGFRRADPLGPESASGDAILRAGFNYDRQLTATTVIANRFLLESGADNTYVENEASVAVSIVENLALKLGLVVRHNTDAPAATDDTDTVTSVSLAYKF